MSKVASEFGNSMVTNVKYKSRIRSFVSSMESLSVCSKERKKILPADNGKIDGAVCL